MPAALTRRVRHVTIWAVKTLATMTLAVVGVWAVTGSALAGEDALVARYRADLLLIEPKTPPDRLDALVARFVALRAEDAQRFPTSHAECLSATRGSPKYNCILVVGDVVKPRWFAACLEAKGATMKSTAPPNAPLHYDTRFCTKTFAVAP